MSNNERTKREKRMLAHILREVRCNRCGREFWPDEEPYSEHWISWRARHDGSAHSLAIECQKCHRAQSEKRGEDMLCDVQLLPGWAGVRALREAFSLLLCYGFNQPDREQIARIADAMSFVEPEDET